MTDKGENSRNQTDSEAKYKAILTTVVAKRRTYPARATELLKLQLDAELKAVETMKVRPVSVATSDLELKAPPYDAKELIGNCTDLFDKFSPHFKTEMQRKQILQEYLNRDKNIRS